MSINFLLDRKQLITISFQVSLGPLMFASKFVLVGDHYQLPPLVQVFISLYCLQLLAVTCDSKQNIQLLPLISECRGQREWNGSKSVLQAFRSTSTSDFSFAKPGYLDLQIIIVTFNLLSILTRITKICYTLQYRMCKEIMELSNTLIYGNRLRCGSSEVENAKLTYSCSITGPPWMKEVNF